MMTARTLLLRGMLVGVIAGLLAIVFGSLFGEPQIDNAIAFEATHTQPGDHEPEVVSRALQSTVGLAAAVFVYGGALGGVFGLVFAYVHGRLGRWGVRATSVLVAAAGFIAIFAVPFLKYPANPPAVGNPDTIGQRTVLYLLMVVISVAAAIVAALAGRSLRSRLGGWNAGLVGAGVFLVIVAAAAVPLPAVDEVPGDFSATVLWRFRLASLGMQLVLWTTLGLLFGGLTERSLRRQAVRTPPPVTTRSPAR
jgi:MFS family permease